MGTFSQVAVLWLVLSRSLNGCFTIGARTSSSAGVSATGGTVSSVGVLAVTSLSESSFIHHTGLLAGVRLTCSLSHTLSSDVLSVKAESTHGLDGSGMDDGLGMAI